MLRDNLYRIDRLAGKLLNGIVYGMLFLAILAGINVLLTHLGIGLNNYSAWPILLLIYKYAWIMCGVIAAACILCRVALSPFVKSEEQEEFEHKVEYILQQKELTKRPSLPDDYSPLRELSAEQDAQIRKILHDLPGNPNKPNAINLALIAQYMTALQKLGYADISDKHNLRRWIAKVTEKDVPSSSQFNEAIPSTANTKIAKAKKDLESILGLEQQIRFKRFS